MKRNIDWNLLTGYIDGRCTPQERAVMEDWIKEDPARDRLVDEFRKVWQVTEASTPDHWDADTMWSHIHKQIEQERKIRPLTRFGENQVSRSIPYSRGAFVPFVRYAAVIVIAVVVTVLVVKNLDTADQTLDKESSKRFITTNGQRATVQLSDGTSIWLNVDSEIIVPQDFARSNREIYLRGEAYFDVEQDSERPFIVHTERSVTKVIGTKFSICAYPEEVDVKVVVAEGNVLFGRENVIQDEGLLLTKGQMGQMLSNGTHFVSKVDVQRYIAWMDGQLVFVDAPFDEVAAKLERWYDLDIVLEDSTRNLGHLNANFLDQPLREILDIVATSFGLEYEWKDRKVSFRDVPAQ